MMSLHAWRTDNDTLRLERARCSLMTAPLDPAAGLRDWQVEGRALAQFNPLCIEPSPNASRQLESHVDYYVRGGDAVVTYADQPSPQMRTQLYWRSATHELDGALCAVELVVSVQTSLLDSCPKVATRTEAVAAQVLRLADVSAEKFVALTPQPNPREALGSAAWPDCYLLRLADCPFSYVEIVPPVDAGDSQLECSPCPAGYRATLRHELFADQLEKGVILRARVLGVLIAREGDEAAAARHYAAFLAAELPLTT